MDECTTRGICARGWEAARRYRVILAAVTLAAAVLTWDLSVELGVAGGVPYVAAVLLTLWIPGRRATILFALVCIGLTLVGYAASPPGGEPWKVLINRLLAVFAIGTTSLVILLRKVDEERTRRLDQRLQRAEKLESLRLLAGGVAHDFNNLLFAITGTSEILRLTGGEPEGLRRGLDRIDHAAGRATALARQMLAYTGHVFPEFERVHLPALVREMAPLAVSATGHRAELEFDLGEDIAPVDGDAVQLRQVVMNLVTNAAEAVPDDGGTIAVRVRGVDLEQAQEATDGEPLPPGEYVSIEVRDDGCGMDRGTLDRVFDPFFSTKFTGRGLGLAAVHGIVRSHRGGVRIHSAPGEGTRIAVLLPEGELSAGVDTAPPPPAPTTPAAGASASL
jgi:signal transduction histidine kinase